MKAVKECLVTKHQHNCRDDQQVLVMLQVDMERVPRSLPQKERKKSEGVLEGKIVQIPLNGIDTPILSLVKLHPESFYLSHVLTNAYWYKKSVRKKERAVMCFWFKPISQGKKTTLSLNLALFVQQAHATWDHFELFENPNNSVAIVCKGVSDHPAKHIVHIGRSNN